MAGIELHKLIDTHPVPFGTIRHLLAYGERLVEEVVVVKTAFETFAEFVKPPAEEQKREGREGQLTTSNDARNDFVTNSFL